MTNKPSDPTPDPAATPADSKSGSGRQALREVAAIVGATLTLPLDALAVFRDAAPKGLKLLHVAPSVSEAELIRQVLNNYGFHCEYVSSTAAGVFGVTGSNVVYVQEDEYEEAVEFLKEYLNPTEDDPTPETPAGNEESD